MKETEIYARLTEIFRDTLDAPALVLRPDLQASDISSWDSFNHINLIAASEVQFGIRFRTAELESLHNVGEFVHLVQQKVSRQ
jgi:acyl carrier protein